MSGSNQFYVQPDLNEALKDIRNRLKALANTQSVPVYTVATRPASGSSPGNPIIFVSDAGAGAQFQGWNGSSWVNLG